MVKIRLNRIGEKKNAVYRVVVADSRAAQGSKVIDQIGSYDPNYEPAKIVIDAEKAKKWLANGAQPTEIAAKILKAAGVEK
ncbi:MAG: 30S ribosomal protein S16 [Lachnospiraceae bacterium]|jgi:small subunit ribosomal protein S16